MKKGMTPESVEQMGSQITEAGDQIQQIYTQIQARVAELDWTGEDRDRYVAEFDGDLGTQVQQAVTKTVDLAERAVRNAVAQRQASA
ncbi:MULTISPECIES: hypothetical protein [unclassified Brachybacterium]|uniref:hypothetical protein n=1 Tax=unclassified Brachybacterium TaxID=2623841 RepID=UPI0040345B86